MTFADILVPLVLGAAIVGFFDYLTRRFVLRRPRVLRTVLPASTRRVYDAERPRRRHARVMNAPKRATPMTGYLGYDPAVSAIRLAADVAHARVSRATERPTRTPLHVRDREISRRGGAYVRILPYELPMFVLGRARDKRIDLTPSSHPPTGGVVVADSGSGDGGSGGTRT